MGNADGKDEEVKRGGVEGSWVVGRIWRRSVDIRCTVH